MHGWLLIFWIWNIIISSYILSLNRH